MKFADIIIPLAVDGVFTYEIPDDLSHIIMIGQRVVVPFGGRKLYTGIVENIHNNKPSLYRTKPIFNILDSKPLVTKNNLKFWKWISQYYMCSLGEVYKNAFPSALKLESETFIKKINSISYNKEDLNEYEILIMESLENKTIISLKEIENFIPQKKIIPEIKTLYEKRFIEIDEKIIEKYSPKKISYLKLNEELKDNFKLEKALSELNRAKKQKEFFFKFIQLERKSHFLVEKKELLSISSPSIVKSLIEKNYLQEINIESDRLDNYDDNIEDLKSLSLAQTKAFTEIKESLTHYNTSLLFGVTSSGKTQIYFKLIQEQIQQNKNSLLLLPEISITTQTLTKIRKIFGDFVGFYHSKMTPNERVEIWKNTIEGKYKVIIGARSAIFLPLENIGLIIVDEEHDSSYKQSDTKPYYNARDAAIILASFFKAKVVLGSATPSLESLYNCKSRKYKLVRLSERFSGVKMPEIELVSLKKTKVSENISYSLKKEIENCLNNKQQIILFHNRRGFAPILECHICGHSPCCPNCDLSLTYHKVQNKLSCHYCGYTRAVPNNCPNCHNNSILHRGTGTQQIEEEIKLIFPNARIERMDADNMRKKNSFENILEKMNSGKIDILVGTQMVTKGLDFKNVHLVGVTRADSLFNIPSFRAEERAIQLLTQVSGRAGRRNSIGKVIIQTFNINNTLFKIITEHDYEKLFCQLIEERKEFKYPPFYRLINICIKDKKEEKSKNCAKYICDFIKNFSSKNSIILGPEKGDIPKINNKYIYNILVKHPSDKSLNNTKESIKNCLSNIAKEKIFKSTKIIIDIDPIY